MAVDHRSAAHRLRDALSAWLRDPAPKDTPEHPLFTARMAVAIALLGLTGLGIALMLAGFIIVGWAISCIAAVLTLCACFHDRKNAGLTEWIIGIFLASLGLLLPPYIYLYPPIPREARLTIDADQLAVRGDGVHDIPVTINNVGQGSALDLGMTTAASGSYMPMSSDQIDQFFADHLHDINTHPAGKHMEWDVNRPITLRQPVSSLTDAEIAKISRGEHFLYVFAIVKYSDEAGAQRGAPMIAQYCAHYDRIMMDMVLCDGHNFERRRLADVVKQR